jgi:hypothetical protein
MSLKLGGGHLFTGPFPIETTAVRANKVPVVYAIVAKGGQSWAPAFRVIDIGASPDEGIDLAKHPSRLQWQAATGEVLGVYLLYLPRSEHSQADRERLARELLALYQPPNNLVA